MRNWHFGNAMRFLLIYASTHINKHKSYKDIHTQTVIAIHPYIHAMHIIIT